MSLKKTLLAITLILLATSNTHAAISCDKTTINVKTEKGRWGYAPLICHTNEANIIAAYAGNLSKETQATVSDRGNGEYIISVIVDGRNLLEDNYYKGRLDIYNAEATLLISLPVSIHIGEGKEAKISLSKDAVRFTFTELNREECYTVEIKNTGTQDLGNLRAENRIHENKNITWVRINNISEEIFRVGKQKNLQICVNNYDNFTGWKERETTIRVRTDETSEEIKVYLSGDWDLEIQKKYDQLFEQYRVLEKAYTQARNYKANYETLDAECSKLLDNATLNETKTRNKTACSTLMEKYVNTIKEYNNLQQKYEKLERNHSNLINATRQQNISCNENNTELLSQLSQAQAKIQELTDSLTEKEAAINLLINQPKKNESRDETNTVALIGNIIQSQPTTIYAIPPAILMLAAAGYLVIRRMRAKKQVSTASPKKESETINAAATQTTPIIDREAQKEALRKLLIQKLAEREAK